MNGPEECEGVRYRCTTSATLCSRGGTVYAADLESVPFGVASSNLVGSTICSTTKGGVRFDNVESALSSRAISTTVGAGVF